ncbi:MAG TPA: hypothetical protein VI688_05290 [Anaerolineales bacterium]|nr:hypothetical protein [Anaerolineales bacterium]
MSSKIAFAISDEFPNLTDDDRLAADALGEKGFVVEPVLWDTRDIDWTSYSTVIIRSCWDYHVRAAEFHEWLQRLEEQGASLWNPIAVILWNMEKTYLRDLERKGIPVLPSVWLPRRADVNLASLMKEQGWKNAVIKPVISAAADHTFLITQENAETHQEKFDALLLQRGMIVQEFAKEIQDPGEWSLMFFDKNYSHAVLKQPKFEDFRVQQHLGGTVTPASPSAALIEQARAILDTVDSDLLYARVDAIERQARLHLMELELIEPHLFFEFHPQAPQRFADAIDNHLAVKE